jgi:hypothetical protein
MIPTYQFASLQMENDAKKRVMKRAVKGQETEEQRVNRSGKVLDSIKNVYRSIIANLELQKTTISTATAFVDTLAYGALRGEGDIVDVAEGAEGAEIEDIGDEHKEKALISYLIASLGKIVGLSSQLVNLIKAMRDEVIATGKPASPAIGIPKIIALMDDVDRLYGLWGVSGFAKSIETMLTSLLEQGHHPPAIDGLLDLWETSNREARTTLEQIQMTQYNADFVSVNIPSKSTEVRRKADIASGVESRDYSRSEYELMLKLREQGYLQDDDFTSVYSGDFGDYDDSTIASYSDDDGDSYTSGSNASSRRIAPSLSSNARSSRSGFSNLPPLEFVPQWVGQREPDSDDDTDWGGNGLYSLPTTQGHPLRYY